MSSKIIILSYFYLNKFNIVLATILLLLFSYFIAYLCLTMIKIKHNNYCTPLMMFVLGEKSCNKMIYKTATDEMQQKLGPIYVDIHNNINDLKNKNFKKNINDMELKSKAVNAKLDYQNMFINMGKTVEDLKNALRNINSAYIDNMKNLQEIYNLLGKITNDTRENLQNSLSKISHLISISYVTPSLYNTTDPLLKLYSAIADYLKLPSKPKLVVNKKTDLSASLVKSKQLFKIQ